MPNQSAVTILTVPCFSGAPWDLDGLTPLSHRPLATMRLPEGLDDIEPYADFVEARSQEFESYVLVGDSFGAVVSLAVAVRQPAGLKALVMSGGFAANPVTNPILKARIHAARYMIGPLYRWITLRFHALSLASPHDGEGQVPWTKQKSRQLFAENTPYRSYVNRAKAAFAASYLDRLHRITVPTLIITPSHDTLIGPQAARQMREGISNATEVILDHTGHMFRFSHPETYAGVIEAFLQKHLT